MSKKIRIGLWVIVYIVFLMICLKIGEQRDKYVDLRLSPLYNSQGGYHHVEKAR